jgi:hypothetical protein
MIPVIMEIIVAILQKERDHTRSIVEAIIDSELNYFFTNDKDYKESRTDIVPTEDKQISDHQTQNNPNGQQ